MLTHNKRQTITTIAVFVIITMIISIIIFFILISRVFSVEISVTNYDDGRTLLQILGFERQNEWIVIQCRDRVQLLKTKDHFSQFRGTNYFRSDLGTFNVKNPFSCCLYFPANENIMSVESLRMRGKVVDTNELPESLEYPAVEEITEKSHDDYEFIAGESVSIEKYDNLLKVMTQTTSDQLRGANLKMKRENGLKIFITLTTSPDRLLLLHYVLRSLDLTLIDNIFITLPLKYKDSVSYQIPTALKLEFPQIVYLSEEKDYGPISKISSSVQFVYENYDLSDADEAIFISIDDDHKYTKRTIDTFVYFSLLNPDAAITAASLMKFKPILFAVPPYTPESAINGNFGFYSTDVEGFAGVAYRGRFVDYKLMKYFTDKSRDPALTPCYFSDDLVITTTLLLHNIPIIHIPYQTPDPLFYTRFDRIDLPHFQDSNALHLIGIEGDRRTEHSHDAKYEACFTALMSHFINFKEKNLAYKRVNFYE